MTGREVAGVAVVGCGLIGRAWAVAFARGGLQVALYDPAPGIAEAAAATLPSTLERLAAAELLHGQSPGAVAGRVRVASELAAALDGADHVQESAPERLEVKQALFAELDALAALEVTLASSTSALLPSAFTEHLPGRDRCVVAHPINPPFLIPAVEIVPAPWTAPATVERCRALMARVGQRPIVLRKEIDGFLMNRLQGALLHEAFRLVDQGYAAAADVDAGIVDGLAPRWALIGPFETIDLNAPGGVRDYVERYHGLYQRLGAQQHELADWAGPVLDRVEAERRQALPLDRVRERQDWRDRRLMALLRDRARAANDD